MPPTMRRPSFIFLLVALAFSLTVISPQMAAAAVHSHHAHAHAKAASSGRGERKVASGTHSRRKTISHESVSGRASSGGSGKYVSRAAVKSARPTRAELRARGRSAVRAHARIRAAVARRRYHGRPGALPAVLVPVRLSIPPPLRGSHESLVHQNQMAEADGLERILDDSDLNDRIAHGSLVPVPVSGALHVNTDLPENRRYCRPWTAKFLSDLAQAHSARFSGSAIEVTSAVRTVEYQRRLRLINGNAAAADGDVASPHLTGGTIDIAKQGLSSKEIGWLRGWLIPLEQQGKIDVEEEFRQSCFHISVYKNYTAPKAIVPANSAPMASGSMLAAHGR